MDQAKCIDKGGNEALLYTDGEKYFRENPSSSTDLKTWTDQQLYRALADGVQAIMRHGDFGKLTVPASMIRPIQAELESRGHSETDQQLKVADLLGVKPNPATSMAPLDQEFIIDEYKWTKAQRDIVRIIDELIAIRRSLYPGDEENDLTTTLAYATMMLDDPVETMIRTRKVTKGQW